MDHLEVAFDFELVIGDELGANVASELGVHVNIEDVLGEVLAPRISGWALVALELLDLLVDFSEVSVIFGRAFEFLIANRTKSWSFRGLHLRFHVCFYKSLVFLLANETWKLPFGLFPFLNRKQRETESGKNTKLIGFK